MHLVLITTWNFQGEKQTLLSFNRDIQFSQFQAENFAISG